MTKENNLKVINSEDFEIFFVDLDGTFYDDHKNASQTNIEAATIRLKKTPVIFASGRRLDKGVEKLLTQVRSPYFIGSNGSLIYKIDQSAKNLETTLVLSVSLPFEESKEIIKYLIAKKFHFSINSADEVYGQSWKVIHNLAIKARINKKVKKYKDFKNPKAFHKISILTLAPWNRRKIIEFLQTKNVRLYQTFGGFLIEIGHKEHSKGSSMRKIVEWLGKNPKNCVHIGDDLNDVTAKGYVGWLIGVANGKKILRDTANIIGPSNKRGGVGKILKGMILKPKAACFIE